MNIIQCRPFRRSDLIGFICIEGTNHCIDWIRFGQSIHEIWGARMFGHKLVSARTICGIELDEQLDVEIFEVGAARPSECQQCLRLAAEAFEQRVGYQRPHVERDDWMHDDAAVKPV